MNEIQEEAVIQTSQDFTWISKTTSSFVSVWAAMANCVAVMQDKKQNVKSSTLSWMQGVYLYF